jgi:hypothetical protein
VVTRILATDVPDLPHDFDEADDGYCTICGYDGDDHIHRVTALRQVADATKLQRTYGV